MKKYLLTSFIKSLFVLLLIGSNVSAQQKDTASRGIRLNQIGFYPAAVKKAIVVSDKGGDFFIQTIQKQTVFTGKLKISLKPNFAGHIVQYADFSAFGKPGTYVLYVPSVGYSYPFEVKTSVHKTVADAAIKAYYFMRSGTALPEKYAVKWHRAEGHPDTVVLIHSSAASEGRKAGSVISSSRGWYDAGDYNKYIVNSGITTSTLLSLYEDFPVYMKTVNLNIPESGNRTPDVLDEVLWNLRWMLTMQDPADGGVYHKLTNAAFDKFEMPDKDPSSRYVVQKGTAATLDFAAVMAQASRIFKQYPNELLGLADSCINAAQKAWGWAIKNPEVAYRQEEMNKKFEPKVTTGAYGDNNFTDEFIWAASELVAATRDTGYLKNINLLPDSRMPVPTWSQVRLLGYYTLIKNNITEKMVPDMPEIKKRLIGTADDMINGVDSNAYQTVMTKSARNFGWGSTSEAANEGILLIQAYKLSHNKKYLDYALANLDYLLGRNGTGYSFVTGYGTKTPMHPHHRPSAADGVIDPIPGLLVGGSNPGMQDGIKVPSKVPDEAYIDDERAYAANEIAINWNAPLAYLANAMEALQLELGGKKN
jgi:endoglucanase